MVVGFPVHVTEHNLDWVMAMAKSTIDLSIDGSDRMTVRKNSAHRCVADLLSFGAAVVYQHHENTLSVTRRVNS